ncbi:MAG: AAA family ATPase [Candidatus Helarchaeota archaeon]
MMESNLTISSISDVRKKAQQILSEVRKAVIGKGDVLQNIFIALLCNEHVLLEGVPGVAKTHMAKNFSQVLGCTFKRIQFTPDMLPSDIIGTNVLDAKTGEFRLRKGPIFANMVLADEINRAPPKTQSALLECMQEKQVTIEGKKYVLPPPFMVLATQNPVEMEGTYPLPEAQVDRFLFKLIVEYPSEKEEVDLLKMMHAPEEVEIQPVTNQETIAAMQQMVKTVHIDESIMVFIRDIVFKTRNDPRVLLGGSPRVSIALLKGAKARAAILGRDYCTPDDIKAIAKHVLLHRLILKPEIELGGLSIDKVISDMLNEVTVPV